MSTSPIDRFSSHTPLFATRLLTACLLFCILAVSGCREKPLNKPSFSNKFADADLVTIYDFADKRDSKGLMPFLSHEDADLRREAAMAYGSVGDSLAIPDLEALLQDSVPAVVAAAAWSIGQFADSSASSSLMMALNQADDDEVVFNLCEALGKCGHARNLDEVILKFLNGHLKERHRVAVMSAIYRFGLRGFVSEQAREFAYQSLDENFELETRRFAAAFLGRAKKLGPVPNPARLDSIWTATKGDDVRQHLVKAYARCKAPECQETLLTMVHSMTLDYRSRVNAVLATYPHHQQGFPYADLALEGNPHVAMAAAGLLLNQQGHDLESIMDFAMDCKHPIVRAKLLQKALSIAMPGGHQVWPTIDSLYLDAGPYEKAALIEAMAQDPHYREQVEGLVMGDQPVLANAAIAGLLNSPHGLMGRSPEDMASFCEQAMSTGDVAVVSQCAGFLREKMNRLLIPAESLMFLEGILKKLNLPEDVEAYNAVEWAIWKRDNPQPDAGKAPITTVDFNHPIDWDFVKNISSGQRALIKTNRGDIRIKLCVEDAPGSVANFVRLAQEGYYDGKFFHRVVPNFVAQGGCPRGDGWGSTPKTIRSEWPARRYGTGTMGIASAGKDTESCQWFITHSSTPHLDGRYNIIGDVDEGMDVVHLLVMGDVIEGVEFPGME